MIPIKGPCPACRRELSWGDVVMRLKMDKAREPTAAVHDEPLSPPQTQRATQEAVSLFNVGSDGSDGGPEVLSEEMLDNVRTAFAATRSLLTSCYLVYPLCRARASNALRLAFEPQDKTFKWAKTSIGQVRGYEL